MEIISYLIMSRMEGGWGGGGGGSRAFSWCCVTENKEAVLLWRDRDFINIEH